MPFPTYTIGTELPDNVNIGMLTDELTAAPGVTEHEGVTRDDGTCTVHGVDPSESEACDAVIAAHDPPNGLDCCKADCIAACRDALGDHLEAETFEHPASSGKLWPLGREAQDFWSWVARDTASAAPLTHRTVDGLLSHTFSDAAALDSFCDDLGDALRAEQAALQTAIGNIVAAQNESAAEAARDTYIGSL